MKLYFFLLFFYCSNFLYLPDIINTKSLLQYNCCSLVACSSLILFFLCWSYCFYTYFSYTNGQYTCPYSSVSKGKWLMLHVLNFSNEVYAVLWHETTLKAVFFMENHSISNHYPYPLSVSPKTGRCSLPNSGMCDGLRNHSVIYPWLFHESHRGQPDSLFPSLYKRHCHLLPSRSLAPFRGDIVVMCAGFLHSLSVVNMRGRDTIISDFMISK